MVNNARDKRKARMVYSTKYHSFQSGMICMSWPRSSAADDVEIEGRGTALRTPTGCFQQGCGEVAVGIGVARKEENDGCPE